MQDHLKGIVRETVCTILEIESNVLSDHSRFKEDHKADSLHAIEILASLEKKLGILIPQEHLKDMTSVEEVYRICSERVAEQNGGASP